MVFVIYIAVPLTFIRYKEKQLDYKIIYEWNGIFSFVLCMPMYRNTYKPHRLEGAQFIVYAVIIHWDYLHSLW